MKRRGLLAATLTLGACSVLPERPFEAKREWPLVVQRPAILPPRPGGGVLLVRSLTAAPGLEDRGLHTLQSDGSMVIAIYETWVSPPALAAEEQLRRWLGDAGLFAAVIGPGSRLTADFVLEAELTALWVDLATGRATAGLASALLGQRNGATRVLRQQAVRGSAAVTGAGAAAAVQAQCRALADAFAQTEAGFRSQV